MTYLQFCCISIPNENVLNPAALAVVGAVNDLIKLSLDIMIPCLAYLERWNKL
jgi:hypothetical protein